MTAFAVAVLFLTITPGPGVLTLAGVGSAFGYQPGMRFLWGLWLGTNLVTLAVASGLAAVAFSVPGLRWVLMIASTGYLFYLACRIAFAGARIAFIESRAAPGFIGGVMLQFINPKAYAVNTVLLSGFAFWGGQLWVEIAIKMLIMNTLWIPVHGLWLSAGLYMRRLSLPGKTQRYINWAMALAMLAVVGITMFASFKPGGI